MPAASSAVWVFCSVAHNTHTQFRLGDCSVLSERERRVRILHAEVAQELSNSIRYVYPHIRCESQVHKHRGCVCPLIKGETHMH